MTTEAWSALISAIGVMTAIGLQVIEWRRSSFSRRIEMMAALDSRFENPEIRDLRRRAAAWLQNQNPEDREGREAASGVINFFETLGYLYGKRAVDADGVWHFFASWLLPYYAATEHLRREIADGDRNVFCEFDKIYLAVKKIEERKHLSNDTLHIVGPDALRKFLAAESCLKTANIPATTPNL